VTRTGSSEPTSQAPRYRVLVASQSFGKSGPEVFDRMREAGCEFLDAGPDRIA
jgi:hypothetical protein